MSKFVHDRTRNTLNLLVATFAFLPHFLLSANVNTNYITLQTLPCHVNNHFSLPLHINTHVHTIKNTYTHDFREMGHKFLQMPQNFNRNQPIKRDTYLALGIKITKPTHKQTIYPKYPSPHQSMF